MIHFNFHSKSRIIIHHIFYFFIFFLRVKLCPLLAKSAASVVASFLRIDTSSLHTLTLRVVMPLAPLRNLPSGNLYQFERIYILTQILRTMRDLKILVAIPICTRWLSNAPERRYFLTTLCSIRRRGGAENFSVLPMRNELLSERFAIARMKLRLRPLLS